MSKLKVNKLESTNNKPLEVGSDVIFSGNVQIVGGLFGKNCTTNLIVSAITINNTVFSENNNIPLEPSLGDNSFTQKGDSNFYNLGKNTSSLGDFNTSNGDYSITVGIDNVTGSKEYNFIKVPNTNSILIFDDRAENDFVFGNTKLETINLLVDCQTGTTISVTSTTVSSNTETIYCEKYLIQNNSGISNFQLNLEYVDCSGTSKVRSFAPINPFTAGGCIPCRVYPHYNPHISIGGVDLGLAPGATAGDNLCFPPCGQLITTITLSNFNVPDQDYTLNFPGTTVNEYFQMDCTGYTTFSISGIYEFRLCSDDGAIFSIPSLSYTLNNDGRHGIQCVQGTINVPSSGSYYFIMNYYQGPRTRVSLTLEWKIPGSTTWEIVPISAFSSCPNPPSNDVEICSLVKPTYVIPSSFNSYVNTITANTIITKVDTCCQVNKITATTTNYSAITTTTYSDTYAGVENCYTWVIDNSLTGRSVRIIYNSCYQNRRMTLNIPYFTPDQNDNKNIFYVCSTSIPIVRNYGTSIFPTFLGNVIPNATLTKKNHCCPGYNVMIRWNDGIYRGPITWNNFVSCGCGVESGPVTITQNVGPGDYNSPQPPPTMGFGWSQQIVRLDDGTIIGNPNNYYVEIKAVTFMTYGSEYYFCEYSSSTLTCVSQINYLPPVTERKILFSNCFTEPLDCFTYRFENIENGECVTGPLSDSIHPFGNPITVNGLTLTETHSGDVAVVDPRILLGPSWSAITTCGNITHFAPLLMLGRTSAFTYTINFSVPVNNVVISLVSTGTMSNIATYENFVFTTDTGTPTICSNNNCYSTTILGNEIISGGMFPNPTPSTAGGGGQFLIKNSTDFTSLTVSGRGGNAGSSFAIYSSTIKPRNIFWIDCDGFNRSFSLSHGNYYDVCALENSPYVNNSGITITQIYSGCCVVSNSSIPLEIIHDFSGLTFSNIFQVPGLNTLTCGSRWSINISGPSDGSTCVGTLHNENNVLYGVTFKGGVSFSSNTSIMNDFDYGVLFSCDTNGNNYSVLHNFGGNPGGNNLNKFYRNPYAGLFKASNGKLYGTTHNACTLSFNQLTGRPVTTLAPGGGIYSFDMANGRCTYLTGFTRITNFYTTGYTLTPDVTYAKLTQRVGEPNFLYGVMYNSQRINNNLISLIYKYDIVNDVVTHLVHSTTTNFNKCYTQLSVLSSPGILYGTSLLGGAYNYGTIFSFNVLNSSITILHSFNLTNGANPSFLEWAIKVPTPSSPNGKLYGTTSGGGLHGAGTIFSFDLINGHTLLYSFFGGSGIGYPKSIMLASDGKLYGLAGGGDLGLVGNYTSGDKGSIYSYDLNRGLYYTIHKFLGTPNEPRYSISTLLEINGCFYGGSIEGGEYNQSNPQTVPINLSTTKGLGTLYKFCLPTCTNGTTSSSVSVRKKTNSVFFNKTKDIHSNAIAYDYAGFRYPIEVLNISKGETSSEGIATLIDEKQIYLSGLPKNSKYTLLEINPELPILNSGKIVSNYFGESAAAIGKATQAKGTASHSEGNSTIAIGNYSHAEGFGTIALGDGSNAGGKNSLTNHTAEFARSSGMFNTAGDAQYSIITLLGTLVGDTTSYLYINGVDENIKIFKNSIVTIELEVSGIVIEDAYGGSLLNEGFVFKGISFLIKNDSEGNLTIFNLGASSYVGGVTNGSIGTYSIVPVAGDIFDDYSEIKISATGTELYLTSNCIAKITMIQIKN